MTNFRLTTTILSSGQPGALHGLYRRLSTRFAGARYVPGSSSNEWKILEINFVETCMRLAISPSGFRPWFFLQPPVALPQTHHTQDARESCASCLWRECATEWRLGIRNAIPTATPFPMALHISFLNRAKAQASVDSVHWNGILHLRNQNERLKMSANRLLRAQSVSPEDLSEVSGVRRDELANLLD